MVVRDFILSVHEFILVVRDFILRVGNFILREHLLWKENKVVPKVVLYHAQIDEINFNLSCSLSRSWVL